MSSGKDTKQQMAVALIEAGAHARILTLQRNAALDEIVRITGKLQLAEMAIADLQKEVSALKPNSDEDPPDGHESIK